MARKTVHIAEWPEGSFVNALCGATAVVKADASLTPPEFDFVLPSWAVRSTCPDCRKAASARGGGSDA